MTGPIRIPGFRGEFLWELGIVTRQSLGLADAFPAEKYDWRPDPKARSASEVFVHVAAGNFMLLDIVGARAPEDLFGAVSLEGPDRFKGLIQRNDELIAQVREKSAVTDLLRRSLSAVSDAITRTPDDELGRSLFFFREQTTVRRVYLRLLVHNYEHMGQLIAYLRANGIATPWQDWRPDRRGQDRHATDPTPDT
ncbi:MAG TPA: DinB family protein [Terriglobales bacterium]|nr:DinB family protein [Terriglobales bacterium]